MATIRKRGSSWQVQVRKKGQTLSKTFEKKADAQTWAAEIEGANRQRHIRKPNIRRAYDTQ